MPNKTRFVGVKFEPGEYRVIAEVAKREERTVGPMIRLLVREALVTRGIKP